MIRRRGEAPPSDSSSDEEDAFSEMSRKNAKRSKTGSSKPAATSASRSDADFQTEMPQPQKSLPVSLTSSMKRHHNPNDTRKAKMDALLQELEAEKNKIPGEQQTFVPDKKGSFVEPSEQHLTTNIFVGNLAPSVTE